jgi:TRAP-type C4-dicarboxylate transport system permease small subunit
MLQINNRTLLWIAVLFIAAWVIRILTPLLWNLVFGSAALLVAFTLNNVRQNYSGRYGKAKISLWLNIATAASFIIGLLELLRFLSRLF